MNRSELVRAVAERAGSDEADARRHVDAVVETVMERVCAGERVTITGFGTFDRLSRVARSARNPRTGLPIEVPAAEVPRFRSGQTFRNRVAGSVPASAAEPAVAAVAAPETAVSVVVDPAPAKKPKRAKSGAKKTKKAAEPKKAPKKARVEPVSAKKGSGKGKGKGKGRAKAAK
ncbi:HU family DNA-binding protein [Actinomadura spongiicola]|uniref:HU family DNA-binding protein n=1 Tax=Actinomadura spongiicola TaxID=2303421 RepID=A0A372G7B1_9ACTN|nr:HU family DNA-binding protein [Actinomadura spongiicola]RFS81241.1 HU family DNA-binding protein [Actinomadura spongiicola]